MPKKPTIVAGNYMSRVDDAVYVDLGTATIYYAGLKVIALGTNGVLYRVNDLDSGIVYKRIRAALMRHKAAKVQQLSREDLQTLVEATVMTFAAKLVDEALKP